MTDHYTVEVVFRFDDTESWQKIVDFKNRALDTLLTIDIDRWRQEIGFRQAHLEQFANLPEEIWAAHRRVAEALGD